MTIFYAIVLGWIVKEMNCPNWVMVILIIGCVCDIGLRVIKNNTDKK